MKIRVFQQHLQNCYRDRQKAKEIIKKKLLNSDVDVLLIETPIKRKKYWTDIFTRSKETGKQIRNKIEDKGISVLMLIADDFLGWDAQDLVCFSTLTKAKKIKKIIEEV